MKTIIGIDIGGTKCSVSIADVGNGIVIAKKISFPTETEKGFEHSKSKIFDAVDEILRSCRFNPTDIEAVGISCGGPLDSRSGIIMSPPNLPGWDNIPFTEMIYERFGIPAYLQNDANACALSEWKLGAGKGCENIIFLTMGTGMGAGIISQGTLIEGANGMCGEVGHIRIACDGPEGYGKNGSFEGFCGGGGIGRLAMAKTAEWISAGDTPPWIHDGYRAEDISARLIAAYADKGDRHALEIFDIVGERLGEGLSILIDTLNPQRVIIGSVFARSGHYMRQSMERALQREALGCSLAAAEIVPAGLGEAIGDYASIMAAGYPLGLPVEPAETETDSEVIGIYGRLFIRYPGLEPVRETLMSAYCIIRDAYKSGNKLLLCGNGGSAADCGHIAGELLKGFYKKRLLTEAAQRRIADRIRELYADEADGLASMLQGALKVIDLTQHGALSTAFSNDVLSDLVFAQQVQGFGNRGDALISISTSGNAKNCCLAALTAKALGISVISLTGPDGGKLARIADCAIKAPGAATADIQENHLPIYHTLCSMLEEKFF